MTRGELYRVRKAGGEAKEGRTFVVVSRQVLIDSRFASVICAPIFANGEGLSTQVAVGPSEGLKHPSWVMCDSLVSLRKEDLKEYVGSLAAAKLRDLNEALKRALGLA
jgi:mRNA interferase MazF